MSKRIDIDWIALFLIILFVAIVTGLAIQQISNGAVIKECIRSHGNPVVSNGELKECRR